jgi:hypothetical protein
MKNIAIKYQILRQSSDAIPLQVRFIWLRNGHFLFHNNEYIEYKKISKLVVIH